MTPEQWQKIKKILDLVLNAPVQEHAKMLEELCGTDNELKREVLVLVQLDSQANNFLSSPLVNIANLLSEDKTVFQTKDLKQEPLIMKNLVGQTIDNKYFIEKQLGQGGMGAVYQAIHLGTERPVAVKVIAPEFMSNPEFVERFKLEAKAMGKLRHPNIVNITDFGFANINSNKIAFLVMEYLDGFTLSQYLKEKTRISIAQAVDILEQTSSALDQAHKQGIIHRDLKPDNIWLEPNGRGGYNVKILDFGLAKLKDVGEIKNNTSLANPQVSITSFNDQTPTLLKNKTQNVPQANSTAITQVAITNSQIKKESTDTINNTSITLTNADTTATSPMLTRAGTILGTPLYMSPEQCKGQKLDASSDIYSLGIILYQMLTSQLPFQGDLNQLIKHHTEVVPIAPHKKSNHIPKSISDIVMIALEKSPNARFLTAKSFAATLRLNFEDDKPLLSKATNIYWENFKPTLNISIVIVCLFTIISSLALTPLIQLNFNIAYGSLVEISWLVLQITTFLVFTDISVAAFSLSIKQLQETGNISSKVVLIDLFKNFPALLITSLKSYIFSYQQIWKFFFPSFRTYLEYSLSASISILEKKKGYNIMNRSQKLLKNFYSLTSSLKLRSLCIRTIAFILFLFSLMFNLVIFNSSEINLFSQFLLTCFSILIIPGLFMILISPIVDIATALLYFKSLEADDETTKEDISNLKEAKLFEKAAFSNKNKAITAAMLIISILFSSYSYILIVPPFEKPIALTYPKFEKVADSENAWTFYNLAIQSLLEIPINASRPSKRPLADIISDSSLDLAKSNGDLIKSIWGELDFNEQQLAYLNKNQKAIEYLLEGIKQPKTQFYSELPSFNETEFNNSQMTALVVLVCAEARRLQIEGKPKQAVELALAAYQFSIDMAVEDNALLFPLLVSTVCRSIAGQTLFVLINSGITNAQTDLLIAKKVIDMEKRLPSLYQYFENELQVLEKTLENNLIKNNKGIFVQLYYEDPKNLLMDFALKTFPGLRIKVYNKYLLMDKQYLSNIRYNLDKFDFEKAKKDLYKQSKELEKYWSLDPTNIQVYYLFAKSVSNPLASMRTSYKTYAFVTSLSVFAACSAYKKLHGNFPDSLDLAMSEANLNVPIDPVTNKAIGYRIENDIPVVWFAGVDGKNDGGKVAYPTNELFQKAEGKDIIINYGQIPFVK